MVKIFESERVAVGFVISMFCGTGKSCDVSGLDVDAANVACIAVVMRRRSVLGSVIVVVMFWKIMVERREMFSNMSTHNLL